MIQIKNLMYINILTVLADNIVGITEKIRTVLYGELCVCTQLHQTNNKSFCFAKSGLNGNVMFVVAVRELYQA